MYAFDYKRPASVAEAAAALQATGGKLLAGGQTLLPTMKLRLANPETIIDLAACGGLTGISRQGDAIVIGAMTTHAAVAESADVKAAIPGLAEVVESIGDPHVRNRGTIGGSLANNDPTADYPSLVLALGATVRTNRRSIAADDFFTGLFSTALEDGEIITEVAFPVPQAMGSAKVRNPASHYALVGVVVAKTAGGVRVAVTGASQSGVFRWTAAEQALSANYAPAAIDGLTVDASSLMSDLHADASYRAHLVKVLTRRALTG